MPKRMTPAQRRRARKRKKRQQGGANAGSIASALFCIGVLVIAVVGGALYMKKYAPTKAHLALDEYYTYFHDDEAALIINDTYMEPAEGADAGSALVEDGRLYIERSVLKDQIDDGYVFDDTEQIMRYVTDKDVISVPYGGSGYTVNKEAQSADFDIVYSAYDNVYVAADFASQYSDFTYETAEDPYRAVVETAGFTHNVATLKRKTAIRRLGGPKSKVLKDAKKGETISVIKNHGSWSSVATEDGVVGYVKNSQIGKVTEETAEAVLPAREYEHMSMDGRVTMAWNVVTSQAANAGLGSILKNTSGLDVISPTWFYLNDDEGGIADFSSKEYVKTCHGAGVQVWGLVSDIENGAVNGTTILGRTSFRDNLVGNLIGAALASGMDGINVDFEHVKAEAADSYIEFIKELSLKCEANDLFLSVDDYPPASFNQYYNRSVQADYADYVVLMAYDEHYSGGEEAGSVASLPFVKEGIEGTLQEVPAERLILGMPFYCREWVDTNGTLESFNLEMENVPKYLTEHDLKKEWIEELGQNYAEYTDGDAKHMLWIEDAESLTKKLALMEEYGLAGGSFWRLGFEPENIWTVIREYE